MGFQIASQKQSSRLFFFALSLGTFLAFGFQPLCLSLAEALEHTESQPFIFLGLSFLFFISLPSPPTPKPNYFSTKQLIRLSILPLLISMGFGAFKSPLEIGNPHLLKKTLLWSWILVPIAEELLFRGWMVNLFDRWLGSAYSSWEPFFPISLWASALSFSVWHLQNLFSYPPSVVLFQVLYTFFVGIWLGVIQWQTRKLKYAILGHFLLNFAADWKLLFML